MMTMLTQEGMHSSQSQSQSQSHSYCKDVNCAILPIGFVLLVVDSYYDLCWVLFPSPDTDKALRHYYTRLLTPSFRRLHPGFWWPVYAIYKLCFECSAATKHWNYITLLLFVPLVCRYYGILCCHSSERLQHWWTVVLVRIAMAYANAMALQAVGGDCSWQHTAAFVVGRTRLEEWWTTTHAVEL